MARKKQTLADSGAVLQGLFNRIFRAQSIYFYQLLGVTLFLVIFGLVMVLSASSIDSLKASNNSFAVFNKQALVAIFGLIGLSLASIIPIDFWRLRGARVFFGITLILQLLVLFIGVDINGNRNWIKIAGFAIQPSEFLKIAVVLHVAGFIAARKRDLELSATWYRAFGMMALAMGLVILGKDLGTVIIMFIMFLGVLSLAGLPMKLLRTVILVSIAALPILLTAGSGSRIGRITAWMNPSAPDPNGYNWQSEHGMWAISAGRIFGAGLGESKMKWSWIPEVENDFIFAVISEELGLIGALVVIALFVFLAITFFRIWQRTADDMSRFVVSGVMMWIIFQALINIAVVLRLLPVLGVPLPLISAGGSSLIATLGAIGIVLAIERENHANPLAGRQARIPASRMRSR
ncbi:MAG: FtsW/RodA/SpoVE family cell cycle protein [Rhodoluna sp.]